MAESDTSEPPVARRRVGALIVVAMLALLSLLLASAHVQWPLEDFAEYWAAGRLNAAGRNPYDPDAMLREQQQIGWRQPNPVMMYNPPWTLALAMPLGLPEFHVARSIWLPTQILITLWCASRLWMIYGGAPRQLARVYGVALLWMPTLVALRFGQFSSFLLLGLVGFLWSWSRRREVAAGAFFALTAVKPQLVALVWVPFVLWALADRQWKVLAGAAGCIVGAGLVALATNPGVFMQYQHLMASAPPTLEFESPNIATVVRRAAGTAGSWPQFVPTCLGAVMVGVIWYRRRNTWDWRRQLPGLVLASCLLTSYGGWAFDLVVLLIPILATAAIVVKSGNKSLVAAGAGVFMAVSFLAFAMHQAQVRQAAFLWMTPAVAIASWALARNAAQRLTRVSP
jgi:hypothetical protein